MAVQAILGGVAIGLKALSAYNAYDEGKDLKEQYAAAGRQLKAESYRQADIIREEGIRFAEEQKMSYMATGVQYAGSALVTVAQTKAWSASEAEAQERRGDAQAEFQNQLGRQAAQQGRNELIKAAFDIGSTFATGGLG